MFRWGAGGRERELQECKSLNERCREEVEGAMATITHVVKEKEDLQVRGALLRRGKGCSRDAYVTNSRLGTVIVVVFED